MARLPRPYVPLPVRCRVALCQLGNLFIAETLDDYRGRMGELLRQSLDRLAELMGCSASDLHLDHDPPLGAREKIRDGAGNIIEYIPAANNPDHLRYRPHGPRFERSHLIKTNVRGDHGQHPDRVLIKRQRRRERMEAGEIKQAPKQAWPKRKMRSVSAWPKGRKIQSRKRWGK